MDDTSEARHICKEDGSNGCYEVPVAPSCIGATGRVVDGFQTNVWLLDRLFTHIDV